MNNAEYLCHSSGPWKKHKYFQKIGEGANAVYRYTKQAAKDTAGKLTGDYYDSQANKLEKDAKYYQHEHSRQFELAIKDAAKERTPEEEEKYEQYWRNHRRMMSANGEREIEAESAARKARKKAENAPLRKLKNRFKTTTKATVTDTMTGEKRKVDPNDPFYKSLEKATKKKKKAKHDGMYSSEYLSHADEVARGQAKIDALFGR